MVIARRRKKGDTCHAKNVTPQQWLDYLAGKGDVCPGCSSTSKWRLRHMNRYHQLTKPELLKLLPDKKDLLVTCEFHEKPKKCLKKNIDRCLKTAMKQQMKRLEAKVIQEISDLEKEVQSLHPEAREYGDTTAMLAFLKSTSLGKPITKTQYMKKKREQGSKEFVFCSRGDAKDILTQAPSEIPIIRRCPPMANEGYGSYSQYSKGVLRRVATKKWVDVYDPGKRSLDRVPEKMTGEEAIRRFHSHKEPPINMLNEAMTDKEAEDDWMAKIPGCDLVERVFKLAKEDGLDLTKFKRSMQVLLLACRRAITLFHADKNSATTRIKPIMGSKLWLVSSNNSVEGLKSFAEEGTPPSDTFVMLVEEGYEMIHSGMTIHSVETCDRSILFCYEYLDSRAMLSILKQTLLELEHDNITNDDHHEDLLIFFDYAMKLWMEDLENNKHELWPDEKYLAEAKETLERIREKSSSSNVCSDPRRKQDVSRAKKGRVGESRRHRGNRVNKAVSK
ncbi:hypothetical protein FOQG_17708 [Fusarium oxysporum f. sp. raphani 54005]|uniref:Uncharacterized protein n=2 Tax=Fusarium oxysporum TaxID=5507 RepID=X0C490_FUSOX|nr:hypothetical protein FOQG_17708 [Fusarium oxysporum f. sp. raphani 54005]